MRPREGHDSGVGRSRSTAPSSTSTGSFFAVPACRSRCQLAARAHSAPPRSAAARRSSAAPTVRRVSFAPTVQVLPTDGFGRGGSAHGSPLPSRTAPVPPSASASVGSAGGPDQQARPGAAAFVGAGRPPSPVASAAYYQHVPPAVTFSGVPVPKASTRTHCRVEPPAPLIAGRPRPRLCLSALLLGLAGGRSHVALDTALTPQGRAPSARCSCGSAPPPPALARAPTEPGDVRRRQSATTCRLRYRQLVSGLGWARP